MAVRLSNYIREQVRDAILAHSFSDREKALDAREKELALEFYNDLYPEAIRAHMYALPNGFLEVRSSIRVQVVGESYHSLDLPEKKRVADCWSHNPGKVYEADHPLGEKLRTYLKDRAQFKRELGGGQDRSLGRPRKRDHGQQADSGLAGGGAVRPPLRG